MLFVVRNSKISLDESCWNPILLHHVLQYTANKMVMHKGTWSMTGRVNFRKISTSFAIITQYLSFWVRYQPYLTNNHVSRTSHFSLCQQLALFLAISLPRNTNNNVWTKLSLGDRERFPKMMSILFCLTLHIACLRRRCNIYDFSMDRCCINLS